MKVLILTQWYPPEPAVLVQELAQTLQCYGHNVTVLTGFPNYPSGTLYPGYRLCWWMRETLSGISVTRVPLYPEHSESQVKRVLNYFSFAVSCIVLGPWLISRPDVIFVYHPPLTVGLPAVFLSRLWRVPFVYQIQDMWPETLRATGMLRSQRILEWIGKFAKWIYKRARNILVISPGFKTNLIAKNVPEKKVYVISNWVDANLYHPEDYDPKLAEDLQLTGKFNVLFAGNIGKAQGLETILNAAKLLANEGDIQFVVIGDGIALPQLKIQAQDQRLKNVKFLGRYPAEMMSRFYALADILLVHLNNDPLFSITIPHKILSYLAVGKPVLAALDGDGAYVVSEAGAGLTCPPQDAKALADRIRTFYSLSDEQRQVMGQKARITAQTQYDRHLLVAEIEKVLLGAVTNNGKI